MEQDKDILKDEELTARIHDIVWQVNKSWEHNRCIEGLVAEIIDTHGAVIYLDIQEIKAMKKSGGEIVGLRVVCQPTAQTEWLPSLSRFNWTERLKETSTALSSNSSTPKTIL